MRGQRHAPAALYPRERAGTHCTGGWLGPRAGLDGRNISSPPGFDPRTVQSVVNRYNDLATRPTDLPTKTENKLRKGIFILTLAVKWESGLSEVVQCGYLKQEGTSSGAM